MDKCTRTVARIVRTRYAVRGTRLYMYIVLLQAEPGQKRVPGVQLPDRRAGGGGPPRPTQDLPQRASHRPQLRELRPRHARRGPLQQRQDRDFQAPDHARQ